MFDRATATADDRHRAFFTEAGDARQVWARRPDGETVHLPDGGVTNQVRTACHEAQLLCPMEQCPDPRLVAKGGRELRHHFAHRVAHVRHRAGDVWRRESLEMLAAWVRERYPKLAVQVEDGNLSGRVALTSPKTNRTISLRLTYDRAHKCSNELRNPDSQLIVGHTRGLLLPREPFADQPDAWWCGEGRLVGEILLRDGWGLAVNPERSLVATLMTSRFAREVLPRRPHEPPWSVVCLVSELEECELTPYGLSTPWVAKLLSKANLLLTALRGAPARPGSRVAKRGT